MKSSRTYMWWYFESYKELLEKWKKMINNYDMHNLTEYPKVKKQTCCIDDEKMLLTTLKKLSLMHSVCDTEKIGEEISTISSVFMDFVRICKRKRLYEI